MVAINLDGVGRYLGMRTLPSLDAHAHIDPTRTADELADSGIVLAMTNSLDEAALVVGRHEPYVVWGVGCHPRMLEAQELFDADVFRELAERTIDLFCQKVTTLEAAMAWPGHRRFARSAYANRRPGVMRKAKNKSTMEKRTFPAQAACNR